MSCVFARNPTPFFVILTVLLFLHLSESRPLRTWRPGSPSRDRQARPPVVEGTRALDRSRVSKFPLERLTADLWQVNLPGDENNPVNLQTYQPFPYLDAINSSVAPLDLVPLVRPKKDIKEQVVPKPKPRRRRKLRTGAFRDARSPVKGPYRFRHHNLLRFQFYSVNAKKVMQLLPNGTVGLTGDRNDPNTILHIQPVLMTPYTVLLRTVSTGIYLCMDRKGRLYTSCNQSDECRFRSHMEKSYYTSLENGKYKRRFLSISNSGKIRRSKRQRKRPLVPDNFFLEIKLPANVAEEIIVKSFHNNKMDMVQHCADYKELLDFNKYAPSTTTAMPATTPITKSTTLKPQTKPNMRPSSPNGSRKRPKCRFKNTLRCIRKNRRFKPRRKCTTDKCKERRKQRRKNKRKKKKPKKKKVKSETATQLPPAPTTKLPLLVNKLGYPFRKATHRPRSYDHVGSSSNSVLSNDTRKFPKRTFDEDFASSKRRNQLKDSSSSGGTTLPPPPPSYRPKRPFRDTPPLAVHPVRHGRRRKGHRRKTMRGRHRNVFTNNNI